MFGAVVFLVCACGVWGQTTWEVDLIDQGTVRGHKDASGDFYSFFDIPYATAPSGNHKYKAPLPPPVWTETFDAVYRGIACPQSTFVLIPDMVLQEQQRDDCLVANIQVPDTTESNLPVLVSIHGGGYLVGFGSWVPQTALLRTKKLIVVTFNYRLGPLGFLCLGTEDIPGNAGMKDQVALLRWLKKNIASFGGNPNDVTIQGCSAGGGSVDMLTLSPMATGLFHKAIPESATSLGIAGALMNPSETAKAYARTLNFTNVDDIAALEEFYKTAPNELLYFDFLAQMSEEQELHFAPCIERDTGTGEEMFLTESPLSLLTKGQYSQVPILTGYSEHEGLYQLSFHDLSIINEMSSNFSRFLPFDLQFESQEQREEVANLARQFFFGDTMNNDSVLDAVKYFSSTFVLPVVQVLGVRRQARNDEVYLYEYGFADENTPLIPNTNVRGVDHCAQVPALIDSRPDFATPEFLQMQEAFREMFVNFVVYGKPVPENSSLPQWPPVSGTRTPHMAIRQNLVLTDRLIHEDIASFWEPIYEKYQRHPIAPVQGNGASVVTHSVLGVFVVIYAML